jgi:hypothetical protein
VVSIDELVLVVDIALGLAPADRCGAADRNRDGAIDVGELVSSVAASIGACAGGAV